MSSTLIGRNASGVTTGHTRCLTWIRPIGETEGYGVDFPLEQYERMAEVMRQLKGKAIVSLNDHPETAVSLRVLVSRRRTFSTPSAAARAWLGARSSSTAGIDELSQSG